ncbi:MAG TPA: DUF3352 domain-containing protein [Blastocatellia bacterium]|nr:DUF3352 domain-containing protein [Blastocatellia bacterium]
MQFASTAIRAIALCASLSIVASAAPLRQQSPQPQPPSAVPTPAPATVEVKIQSDLARCFPPQAGTYIEFSNFESQLESMGGSDALYDGIAKALGEQGVESLPLSAAEVKILTHSDIAIGASLQSGKTRYGFLALIRTPSAESAKLLREPLLRLLADVEPKSKNQEALVHGQSVVRLINPSRAGREPETAYAVAGDTLVIGTPALVDGVFTPADPASAPTNLANHPAFADARERLSTHPTSLIWFDPAATLPTPSPGSKRSAEDDRSLVRLDSVRGFAVASSPGRSELLLELDRTKENLITIATDAPAITLNAAEVVPSSMQALISLGVDFERMFDFANRPTTSNATGQSAPTEAEQLAAHAEQMLGMKLRTEFLPAVGNEVSLALDLTPTIAGAFETPPNMHPPRWLVVIPARDADVLRRGLGSLVRSLGGPAKPDDSDERDYKGTRIIQRGSYACAIVGTMAVLGEPAQVERSIDAVAAESTLASSPDVTALRGQLNGSTIGAVCVTREYGAMFADLLAKSPRLGGSGLTTASMMQRGLSFTVTKEAGGVYCGLDDDRALAPAIIGIVAAIAIPSLVAARRAANESAAIGTLRTLASAEATFQSRSGRFGSLKELVTGGYIVEDFVNGGERNSYVFRQVAVTRKTFEFSAEPVGALGGSRSFNIIEDYVIRYSKTATPPKRTAGKILGAPDDDE